MSAKPPPSPTTGLSARLLTAAILIPSFLGIWWLDSLAAIAAFFGAFLLLAAAEWGAMLGWPARRRGQFLVLVGGLCALGAVGIAQAALELPLLVLACGWWLWVARVVLSAQRGHDLLPAGEAAWVVLGSLVLVPSYLALVALQKIDRVALLGLLVMVWAADTAAYFAGRRWGRRRLASRISPGKTWAGAVAAVATGPVVGAGIALWPGAAPRPVAGMALLGGFIVVASVFGDLFESLVKRRGGVKDSGAILPGHGGVLDRIDSLLAAAPFYALAFNLMADGR